MTDREQESLMRTSNERARFERWVQSGVYQAADRRVIECMWDAWQARATPETAGSPLLVPGMSFEGPSDPPALKASAPPPTPWPGASPNKRNDAPDCPEPCCTIDKPLPVKASETLREAVDRLRAIQCEHGHNPLSCLECHPDRAENGDEQA